MSIRVHLDQFEGPLDLLLHLIRKNEMDIYDIEIHKITNQYLEFLKIMKELDLELAGEFIAMASMLIQIKSKMLLPNYDENGEVIVEEDPRKELVSRLVEYQKYQEASKWFKDRPLLGRDQWRRGFREIWSDGEHVIILDEGGLFAMIGLYRKVLQKAKKGIHVVMEKAQSLSQRILEIKDRLIIGQQTTLDQLVHEHERTKTKYVITFMSILELARLGFISIFQNETCGAVYVDPKKVIEKDVVSQVQELENPEIQGAPVLDLTAKTVKVAEEPEQLEMATDEDIAALEKQLETQELEAIASDIEADVDGMDLGIPETIATQDLLAPVDEAVAPVNSDVAEAPIESDLNKELDV